MFVALFKTTIDLLISEHCFETSSTNHYSLSANGNSSFSAIRDAFVVSSSKEQVSGSTSTLGTGSADGESEDDVSRPVIVSSSSSSSSVAPQQRLLTVQRDLPTAVEKPSEVTGVCSPTLQQQTSSSTAVPGPLAAVSTGISRRNNTISIATVARTRSQLDTASNRRNIEQIDAKTNKVLGVFNSAAAAVAALGLSTYSSIITRCCNTNSDQTVDGYKWKYTASSKTALQSEPDRAASASKRPQRVSVRAPAQVPARLSVRKSSNQKAAVLSGPGRTAARAVNQFNLRTGKSICVYSSQVEASHATGIHNSVISRCCCGALENTGEFGWRFVAERSRDSISESSSGTNKSVNTLIGQSGGHTTIVSGRRGRVPSAAVGNNITVGSSHEDTSHDCTAVVPSRRGRASMTVQPTTTTTSSLSEAVRARSDSVRTRTITSNITSTKTRSQSADKSTGGRSSSNRANITLRSKMVDQLDIETGEVIETFISVSEAERATGVNRGNISSCCRGVSLTAGGFRWRYASESSSKKLANKSSNHDTKKSGNLSRSRQTTKSMPKSPSMSNKQTLVGPDDRSIIQLDLDTGDVIKTFPSSVTAAESSGIGKTYILRCCNRKSTHAGGYGWRYSDISDSDSDEKEIGNETLTVGTSSSSQLSTTRHDLVQNSSTTAAMTAVLQRRCGSRSTSKLRSRNNIIESKVVEEGSSSSLVLGEEERPGKRFQKAVLQIDFDTNKVIRTFPSRTAAAEAIGVLNSTSITDCCSGRRLSAWGFRWSDAASSSSNKSRGLSADRSVIPVFSPGTNADTTTAPSTTTTTGVVTYPTVTTTNTITTTNADTITAVPYNTQNDVVTVVGPRTIHSSKSGRISDSGRGLLLQSTMSSQSAPLSISSSSSTVDTTTNRGIQQIDLETCEVLYDYPSIANATAILGIPKNEITQCCQGEISDAGGYKWRFV